MAEAESPKGKGKSPRKSGQRRPSSAQSFVDQQEQTTISGITLVDDEDDTDSHSLDASLMIDALSDLANASHKTLALLAPQNISKAAIERARRNSHFVTKVTRLRDTFEAQKRCFGNKHYIIIDPVLRALPSLRNIRWQPNELIQKANLTRLALDAILYTGKGSLEKQLVELDEGFPSFFMTSFQSNQHDTLKTGASRLVRETLALGVEIRTQYFIMAMKELKKRDSNYGPSSKLADVFNLPSLSDEEPHDLRGLEIDGFQDEDGDIPKQFYNAVSTRVESIRGFLKNESPPGCLSSLEASYPWSEFVVRAARWIRERANEIDNLLKNHDPLEKVADALQAQIDRRLSRSAIQPQFSQSASQPAKTSSLEHDTKDNNQISKAPEAPSSSNVPSNAKPEEPERY